MLFEKYMLCEDGFRNVFDEDGDIIGFQFKIRVCYYRAVRLSFIKDLKVTVDGREFKREQFRFTTAEGTFTMDEMTTMPYLYWDFGEKATVTVLDRDGLGRGNVPDTRRVHVELFLNIPYAYDGFNAVAEKMLKAEC